MKQREALNLGGIEARLPSLMMHSVMTKEVASNNAKVSKAQDALKLAKAACIELFRDQHNNHYALVKVNDHTEAIALTETRFKSWLRLLYKEHRDGALLSN